MAEQWTRGEDATAIVGVLSGFVVGAVAGGVILSSEESAREAQDNHIGNMQ